MEENAIYKVQSESNSPVKYKRSETRNDWGLMKTGTLDSIESPTLHIFRESSSPGLRAGADYLKRI